MLICTEVEARLITGEGGGTERRVEGRRRGREDAAVRASLVGGGLSKAVTETHLNLALL